MDAVEIGNKVDPLNGEPAPCPKCTSTNIGVYRFLAASSAFLGTGLYTAFSCRSCGFTATNEGVKELLEAWEIGQHPHYYVHFTDKPEDSLGFKHRVEA